MDDYFIWSGYVRLIGCCVLFAVVLCVWLWKSNKEN